MTRWNDMDLAEALSRNPGLRLSRSASQNPKGSHPALERPERAANAKEQGFSGQHKTKTDYKAQLVQQCEIAGLKLEPEFKFHPTRRFRVDWRVHMGMWEGKGKRPPSNELTFVPTRVLIDYEGGIFHKGRMGHDSIKGIKRDIEKHNLAQIEGYVMIRVTPDRIVSGEAFAWITDALKRKETS